MRKKIKDVEIAKFGILFPKNILKNVFLAFLVILFQENTKVDSIK